MHPVVESRFASLKELLLTLAEQRGLDALLSHIVEGIAAAPGVAMARVWLVRPGDICDDCPRRADCPAHVPCLHLVASAGTPLTEGEDWGRLDGGFRRFPIGVRKIGRVAEGEVICMDEIEPDSEWIADPAWVAREDIGGFGGVPLRFQGELLGVLAAFTRGRFCPNTLEWFQIIADQAAAAIANARAFEEIDRLRAELAIENEYLREDIADAKACGDIVGSSAALGAILERVALVAPTDASVLIQGESGTGKELIARAIHDRSERAGRALIEVNCAAIPHELYESEFFGHVRGAFTGAARERAGRFAAADGGTLFLDEVGEIPLELQSKLLRVLQEKTYERVGEERARTANVRVIAATNRDLRAEVAAGRFREDLYYRLDVFPIAVPPLRERADDIVELADHFVERSCARLGRRCRRPPALSAAARDALLRYDWPGNVRELQNVIERAVITWTGGPLDVDPGRGGSASDGGGNRRRRDTGGGDGAAGAAAGEDLELMTEADLRELEKRNIEATLRRTEWKISGRGGAADLLGVKPTTLSSRIRKLGIERPL